MTPGDGYAICVTNAGYPAALDVRKVYRLVRDLAAEGRGLVRVIDESGEDYLYPRDFFVPIDVPGEAVRVFSA